MGKKVGLKEKQRVVEQYLCGEKVESICKDTSYPRSTVYDWIRQYKSWMQNHQINIKDYKILKTKYERQKLVVHILQNAPCRANDSLHDRLEAIKELSSNTQFILCVMHLKSPKELITIFFYDARVKILRQQSVGRSLNLLLKKFIKTAIKLLEPVK